MRTNKRGFEIVITDEGKKIISNIILECVGILATTILKQDSTPVIFKKE